MIRLTIQFNIFKIPMINYFKIDLNFLVSKLGGWGAFL